MSHDMIHLVTYQMSSMWVKNLGMKCSKKIITKCVFFGFPHYLGGYVKQIHMYSSVCNISIF